MDNTRKELADMKQTLYQLMSKIETVEKENILLRSQAQLTKISGAKQTFQENASHTCEAKSDTRKAKRRYSCWVHQALLVYVKTS